MATYVTRKRAGNSRVSDYTARIIAVHPGANTPLEAPYILWQR